ncbi:uncharacterized protein LOC142591176 [Dermacentor variabilis]|uniref:uncharacterized protein LOC142591176 n=1 Tax=Dermacentor variabilis TaxID=34621 RepID=UPI003F5BF3D0
MIQWWVVLAVVLTLAGCGSYEERLKWCGKQLNPRDFARAMRAATDIMLSCKDYIMKLDLSPLILKERRWLCVAMRICYAQASYHNSTINQLRRSFLDCVEKSLYMWQAISPELFAKLRLNVTNTVEAGTKREFPQVLKPAPGPGPGPGPTWIYVDLSCTASGIGPSGSGPEPKLRRLRDRPTWRIPCLLLSRGPRPRAAAGPPLVSLPGHR